MNLADDLSIHPRIGSDVFNLLCGDKLGAGIHRTVFACKLREDLVVKVETDTDLRDFSNVLEMRFWCDNEHYRPVARWLAPCEYMSPDGYILLQRRVNPIQPGDKLPEKLPAFLTDVKRSNFGWLDGKLVCVDYCSVIHGANNRLKKVNWL